MRYRTSGLLGVLGSCASVLMTNPSMKASSFALERSTRRSQCRSLVLPSQYTCSGASRFGSSSEDRSSAVAKAPTPSALLASTSSETAVDRSTLTLLEHVNLNVPSHEYILPFYFDILQCGMDPRKAANLAPDAPKKTIWANMGASQFHLPYGDVAQTIPGIIGLRFDSLDGLKKRLQEESAKDVVKGWTELSGGRGVSIRIEDNYGNVFLCSAKPKSAASQTNYQQPYIRPTELEKWGDVATTYGKSQPECRGLDFVEIRCPPNTADDIALFYDSVFDATTTVLDVDGKIAIIGFGDINENGQPEQSLLFRESPDTADEYDGHHIAMYVGDSVLDFEQAFKNAKLADIVWVNPRFSDDVMDLGGARKWKQFRFKDIVNIQTGETIMELEHELRSIEHESWPGAADA
eukprot:CAMPEP_0198124148 /NCGR_PEP_ID=MMETSP1442-20131203/39262_1 /TAXON_ID= /ORGANISM="Craspedostauros australis, Strain CCMP3328" /LENGTH=406 /DNA_ID=CAMNT_0043783489 /DNA_START=46 /DNA_END=1266 /DNA_ORIENTATION=-